MLVVVAWLLTGCAAMPQVAESECAKTAGVVSEYNDSRSGDGRVASVKAGDAGPAEQHPDGGDAYYVSGTSEVVMEGGGEAAVHWTCFVQRVDGKLHPALTEWRRD